VSQPGGRKRDCGRPAPVVEDLAAARGWVGQWRADGDTIVWSNGCFDLLHPGHVESLRFARAQGDALVVGVNSDATVRALKGIQRPFLPLADRCLLIAALRSVDLVVPFDAATPLECIQALVPDVLVKGPDYADQNVVGADVVRGAGVW